MLLTLIQIFSLRELYKRLIVQCLTSLRYEFPNSWNLIKYLSPITLYLQHDPLQKTYPFADFQCIVFFKSSSMQDKKIFYLFLSNVINRKILILNQPVTLSHQESTAIKNA